MVFIVSEIGVNWDGDFDLAKSLICGSKNAGCDAVKFQAYKPEHIAHHPQSTRLQRAAVNSDNVKKLKSIADEANIELFCTPFYPEVVDWLNPLVKRFKIREIDSRPILQNRKSELIDTVLATGKEIMISSTLKPLDRFYGNHPNIRWLYCVPKYPCVLGDIDFTKMRSFQGYSNHCPKIIAPLTAAILGTGIIEVHVTLDRRKDYIDNNVSFELSELAYMVEQIRLVETMRIR